MIKCSQIVNELEAYRKDVACGEPRPNGREVASELKTLVASHLSSCNACQNELKVLEQLDNLLDAYTLAPVVSNLEVGLNQKLEKLENAYSTNPDGFSEREPGTGRFHLGWRRVGLLASAAVVMVAALVWLVNPFNGSNIETEIITNIELLEDMETAQVMDIVQDYELVEAMPEIMDADLNGE